MKLGTLNSDPRFTVTMENARTEPPLYVVRFCGDIVASFRHYSSAIARAAGEAAIRRGCNVVTERGEA
jgi:hypothetical protein